MADIGVQGETGVNVSIEINRQYPPDAPGTPTITVGNNQLTVTWDDVDGATSYEVWINTSDNTEGAEKH